MHDVLLRPLFPPDGVFASLEAFLCAASSWKPSQTTRAVGAVTPSLPLALGTAALFLLIIM